MLRPNKQLLLFFTFYVFGSCFRMLAVILVSVFFMMKPPNEASRWKPLHYIFYVFRTACLFALVALKDFVKGRQHYPGKKSTLKNLNFGCHCTWHCFISLNKSHINFAYHSTWHCFIYLTSHMCVECDVFKNAVMLISSMLSSKHNHTQKVHPSHH